ncbi:hypothetical protein [Pseudoxanthomonas sangjuensis]|uniref:hypothetical protein n=1 Tax=Pseudoxanthomonas sangjuensis TaxID=1503750 RepID=UPI001390823A|nr:hypothetical protein [Pseudoxanthomonas sangjuensis]
MSMTNNPDGSTTVVVTLEGGESIAVQIAVDHDYARLATPVEDGVRGVFAVNLDCCPGTEARILMLQVMVPPPPSP